MLWKNFLFRYGSFLLIVGLSTVFQILETSTSLILHYERTLFDPLFFTQWLTPSLVHVNWTHWFLNIVNLWALIIIFPNTLSSQKLLSFFISSSMVIMLSLDFFSKNVDNYAGMSGVLYGLTIYASIRAIVNKEKVFIAMFLLLYVVLKLLAHDLVNHYMGVDILLENIRIITDVHWYGAIFGLIYYFTELLCRKTS